MNKEQKIARVICLPTSDKSSLIRNTYIGKEHTASPFQCSGVSFDVLKQLPVKALETRGYKYHHLYITSDDEIGESDWFINGSNVCKYVQKAWTKNAWLKIIASTDPKLTLRTNEPDAETGGLEHQKLPQPPQQFMEEFCKRGGKVDEVMVDYEKRSFHIDSEIDEDDYHSILKVNPDNTINIRQVEKHDEILEKLNHVITDLEMLQDDFWIPDHDSVEASLENLNWIKDNL